MFVSDAAILDVSFEVALARSGFRDLITRPGRAVLAVRWETGGHDGEPFPVLDADLTLTAAGPDAALFQLAGVYRAGPDEDGHRTAAMPLGGFLDRIAEAITRQVPPPARPPGTQVPTGPDLRP